MTVLDPFRDFPQQAEWCDRDRAMLRHDIESALHGILGGAGQLEQLALSGAVREQVERVAAAARALRRFLSEDAREEPAASDACVDLARLVSFVRRRYAGEARERGLSFEVRVSQNVPASLPVGFNPTIRILDNLIGNSLRTVDRGAVRMTVDCGTDGSVAFRVTDEGPGTRPGSAGLSQRPSNSVELQIVKALTEEMGGTVQIVLRDLGGVEAEVRLPPPLSASQHVRPMAPAGDLAGLRVLLAEDNPTNQMVASQMLRALSAEVIVCADGVEALDRFDTDRVDLVVVDIEMPRLSGLDVIRSIRSRGDERAQIPIVALTAYAMREHRERIAAAGANGLISKPIVSVEALGRALAGYVTIRTPAAEAGAVEALPALTGPVIDQATFDALAEAIGQETMAELIEKVVADLRSAQASLIAAQPALDRGAIRSASHILISVAGAIGAVRLQTSARALNTLAHGDEAERIGEELRRCLVEIDAAVAFADSWRQVRP